MNPHFSCLIAMVSDRAVSFCGCGLRTTGEQRLNDESISALAAHARELGCAVYLLQDDRPIDDKWEYSLESLDVQRAVPLNVIDRYPQALCVMTAKDLSLLDALSRDRYGVASIQLSLAQADLLPKFYCRLFDRFERINVSFTDIAESPDADFSVYRDALMRINDSLTELLTRSASEIGHVTDPLVLTQPRACGAGHQHATLAPDNAWYVCPAFYLDEKMRAAGTLAAPGTHYRDTGRFDPERFPLCVKCECHHCPRCVYLHQKYTGEFSTPPLRQCLLSHFEYANASVLSQALLNTAGLSWPRELKRPQRLDPLWRSGAPVDALELKLWEYIMNIEYASATAIRHRDFSHSGIPSVSRLELDEITTLSERMAGLQEMIAEPHRFKLSADAMDITVRTMQAELQVLQLRHKQWWNDARRRYLSGSAEDDIFHVDFQNGEITQHSPADCAGDNPVC